MNSKIIIFIIAMAAGVALMLSGAYLAIDNYLHPQGLMFEGIVLGALGTLLTLMVTIAMSIGETVMIFGQIMEQQVQIQREMREMAKSAPARPGNINSILSKLLPGMTEENTSISITDLTTGEMPDPKDFPIDLEHVKKMMSKGRNIKPTVENSELEDMGLEQLEKELAKSIKKDDYERAHKINHFIKNLKGGESQDDSPEEKSE